MPKKKVLNNTEFSILVKEYIIDNFESYAEAGRYFDLSRSTITQIIKGNLAPSEVIVEEMGYRKTIGYVRR